MVKITTSNIWVLFRFMKVIKHKKRQEFLADIVESIIKCRSVHFSEIAHSIESVAKQESVIRKIERFFLNSVFDYVQLAKFLVSHVHHNKVTLAIDRTEWDFGKTQVNILCVTICVGKMSVPVYFEMLDNKSGNSNWENRVAIFEKIIETIGIERIKLLVMDREFIGNKWLKWLKSKEINFCVRVPKSHLITFSDGYVATAETLYKRNPNTLIKRACVDSVSVNISISLDASGELLFLIGNIPPGELKGEYRKRWTIETFFQALKERGFNLEDSHLQSLEKYRKLFAVLCIAYTICWSVGIESGRTNPVKPKKHGYPQYSVFRRGLNLMRDFYKFKVSTPIEIALGEAIKRICCDLNIEKILILLKIIPKGFNVR